MPTFVCFSTESMKQARRQIVCDAAALGIFDKVIEWDEYKLSQTNEFRALPPAVSGGPRCGYFWWKPFIIRDAIDKTKPEDFVFYSDCGRYDGGFRLGAGAKALISRYAQTGFAGVEVPQFGASKMWTRSSVKSYFIDIDSILEKPQIQATFNLWVNKPHSVSVLREWESLCRIQDLISDPPLGESQSAFFLAHRHDQSILSILTRLRSLNYIQLTSPSVHRIVRLLRRSRLMNVGYKDTQFVSDVIDSRVPTAYLFMKCLAYKARSVL